MKNAAVIALLVIPRLALADGPERAVEPLCAEIEPGDSFDDAGHTYAKTLLVRTLEGENQLVVEAGCTSTFRVAHHLAGTTWTVRISGPRGSRRWTNASAEKLPDIYRQLVKALLVMPVEPLPAVPPVPAAVTSEGPAAPMVEDSEPALLGRQEVGASSPPRAPFPLATPDFGKSPSSGGWYVHAGMGGVGGVGGGGMFGVGYRHVSGARVIDGYGAVVGGEDGGTSKLGFELMRVAPHDSGKAYYGGGVSIGSTEIGDTSRVMTVQNGGLGGELTAGIAHGKVFVQADLSLPFYGVGGTYPAAAVISVGYGKL